MADDPAAQKGGAIAYRSEFHAQLGAMIAVGDRPGHFVAATDVVRHFGGDHRVSINGLDAVSERDSGFSDTCEGNGRAWGYVVFDFEDGSRLFGTYEGTNAAQADGTFRFSGVTTLGGGTGRQSKVQGQVRYQGHVEPATQLIVEHGEGRWWLVD